MPGGKNRINGSDGKLFVAGDPRINKLGRPRKVVSLDRLLREVLCEKINNVEAIKGILIALRDNALKGDTKCAEILLDRCFGKVKQPIETSGLAIIGIKYVVPDGNTDKADFEATRGLGSHEDAY